MTPWHEKTAAIGCGFFCLVARVPGAGTSVAAPLGRAPYFPIAFWIAFIGSSGSPPAGPPL